MSTGFARSFMHLEELSSADTATHRLCPPLCSIKAPQPEVRRVKKYPRVSFSKLLHISSTARQRPLYWKMVEALQVCPAHASFLLLTCALVLKFEFKIILRGVFLWFSRSSRCAKNATLILDTHVARAWLQFRVWKCWALKVSKTFGHLRFKVTLCLDYSSCFGLCCLCLINPENMVRSSFKLKRFKSSVCAELKLVFLA